MAATSSFFIASIGNPGQTYYNTLHSAGHILLRSFAELMNAAPFHPDPILGNGLTTETYLPKTRSRLTLWQSPSYMNTSGPSLARAYKSWLARENLASDIPIPSPDIGKKKARGMQPMVHVRATNLILLHDELERSYGNLYIRYGGPEMSSRGHNGIKSVVESLVKARLLSSGGGAFSSTNPTALIRLAIGVGRPMSRERDAVSDYLLKSISKGQHDAIAAKGIDLRQLLEREISRIQKAMKPIEPPAAPAAPGGV
ncbi:peptidyl-tRNA hydrolase [Trichophyton mentagrophytes]|nr:peptidyl-tRNA hydrolase [Trichophyton mentagrophytes]